MSDKLRQSFDDFDNYVAKEETLIPATMGITIGGRREVVVPNRKSFVYVRLRSNLSEVIQAFNDRVSPSYRLPVLLKRDGNRYIVWARDTEKYNNWDENPFPPRHAETHIFDKDGGNVGGDPVWVYPYQFMPSLVTPFGQQGAENVYIQPYTINFNNDWKYVGNTGTVSLTQFNPMGGCLVLLISLDAQTGNPYYLSSSGTFIAESVTGTSQLLNYIPDIQTSRYIPLSFVRLVSGTNSIGWNHIHDVRQFITVTPTGSMGIFHNELQGIQGGAAGSYFHLTESQHDGLVDGLPTSLHSHTGTTGGDIVFNVDGHLALITGACVPFLVTKPMTAPNWYMYLEYKGIPSGTTIVDVNLIRTGTYNTLFSNQANRPMLNWNDDDGWVKSGAPGIVNFIEGDIISPDIDQIATGSYGLVLVGKVESSGIPSTLVVRDASGTTSVLNVVELIVPNGMVTSPDGGSASIKIPVAQIVETQTGAVDTGAIIIPFDDSIPQNTEGEEFLTQTITPIASANQLLIEADLFISTGAANQWVTVALFQDSNVNAVATALLFVATNTGGGMIHLQHSMVAGVTSPTTFKIRAGQHQAGTITLNGQSGGRLHGGVLISSLKITEYMP